MKQVLHHVLYINQVISTVSTCNSSNKTIHNTQFSMFYVLRIFKLFLEYHDRLLSHDISVTLPTLIYSMIEFRCVVTVSTPVEWLARENIKRLTPRPCINVEYSHGVVYMENTT